MDSVDEVKIKIIPRIDYLKDSRGAEKRKKGSAFRAIPKLFSPDLVEDKRTLTSYRDGYWQFQNEMFDKEGYMEKVVKVASLTIENVNPSLEEITNFTGGGANMNKDLEALLASNLHTEGDFGVGEKVEVVGGELAAMQGVVVAVENGIVTIQPVDQFGLNVSAKSCLIN
jgi:transcription elongation factor SPT5